MGDTLLNTKFYIPAFRQGLITRVRLIKQIQSGLNGKLTLISAPAGFGKSTLVAMWAQGCGFPIAWVSLDRGDNDPAQFLTYIFTAINSAGQVGDALLAEIRSPQRPPDEAMVRAWINELADHPSKLILILDDYHVIENPTIQQNVEILLEYSPPNFHLILISRSDPHLQLARLRGSGQLNEIREADLRFKEGEVSEFFDSIMGLRLSVENVSALEQRTEGWVVGLQLVGLALQGREDVDAFIRDFTGGHQFILDYLTEEVFDRQPEEIQKFLIQTCILDQLCGPLCNVVAGVQNGATTLEILKQKNLFIIPLDEYREWYRYHHLFVELLRYKLDQLPPDQVAGMHERASSWYAENDLVAEAVYHAMAAQNYARAADLIESITSQMIGRGEVKTVRDWIVALPETLVKERARLCITLAWVLNLNNTGDPIEPLLQDAERALETGRYDEATVAELRGHAATLRGYTALQQDNPAKALQHMGEAMALLPEEDVYLRSIVSFTQGVILKRGCVWDAAEKTLKLAESYGRSSGNYSIAIGSRVHLIEMLITQGKLRQAAKFAEEALAYYLALFKENPMPNLGFVYTKLGEILYEWNDLDAARENLTHGLALGSKIIAAWGWERDGLVCLSRLRQVKGEPEAAQALLEQALDVNEHMQDLYDKMDMSFEQARLWLAQEKMTPAIRWARAYQSESEGHYENADVMLARVLLAQGDINQSKELSISIGEDAEARGRMYRLIEASVLLALAHKANKENEKAFDVLSKALSLGEPEGFLRVFVDEGTNLLDLLHKMEAASIDQKGGTFLYLKEFLSRIKTTILAEKKPSHLPDHTELINERERQILRLMSAGLKTPEIAEELFLSKNTIKWHVRIMYEKLDVHSRADAIERGHQLGLLK